MWQPSVQTSYILFSGPWSLEPRQSTPAAHLSSKFSTSSMTHHRGHVTDVGLLNHLKLHRVVVRRLSLWHLLAVNVTLHRRWRSLRVMDVGLLLRRDAKNGVHHHRWRLHRDAIDRLRHLPRLRDELAGTLPRTSFRRKKRGAIPMIAPSLKIFLKYEYLR